MEYLDSSLSLAINVIDGMFAYQKAIGGHRVIGDVGDDNMDIVLKNIRSAVRIIQNGKNSVSRFWRVWPWMFRLAHPGVPKFKMIHQFPMLNPPIAEEMEDKSKKVPGFIYSGDIRSEMASKLRGSEWNSMISLTGPDATWMMKHDLIRVFDPHGVWSNRALMNLAKELQTGRRLINSDECGDTQSFKQVLQYYYQFKPEAVVMMLYARFMPNFLLSKLPHIKTVQMFNIILCTETLMDYPYSILRVGLPAVHKLYRVPYPSCDLMAEELPDVEVPEELQKTEKRTKPLSGKELADLY